MRSIILNLLLCCLASLAYGTGEPARTWADTQGRSFEGVFVSADGDVVTIKRSSDRREFAVPLTSLSQGDREYVAKRLAEAKAPEEPVEEKPLGQTYPAKGELLIEIPHGHKIDKWEKCEAALVVEKLDDPNEEVVLAKGSAKLKWDAREHGMTGTIEFKEVAIPPGEKPSSASASPASGAASPTTKSPMKR